MNSESAPVQEGEVLGGKYRVGRVLGQGGMGVVVAATHLQLDQPVAIKFLLSPATVQPEVVARFTREARTSAKIKSEHVARVLDVGTLAAGAPYMVMEYLQGEDLERVLARTTPAMLSIVASSSRSFPAAVDAAAPHSPAPFPPAPVQKM